MYINVNQVVGRLDSVYSSNLQLNQITNQLRATQNSMFQYLDTKSSESLENYYASQQEFSDSINQLSGSIANSETGVLEHNIKNMGDAYLAVIAQAVQAKRGRNVERYSEYYSQSQQLYGYLTSYITKLNNLHFQSNSDNYELLRNSIHYLELIGVIILLVVIGCDIAFVVLLTRRITKPLETLAVAAKEVSGGNLEVDIHTIDSQDEVEELSRAFQTMLVSIRRFMTEQRESIEKENEMRQQDLKNQTLLKDAQLKYLQSQINPHFLFNTLNAGMQLAMIEDAEKTAVFIENMAEFFRYNLSKSDQETTLGDEITLVEHYLYILNVRFGGAIHFQKEVDESLLHMPMPSMILQPLVENAYQYGIREMEEAGTIRLLVEKMNRQVVIHVQDEGRGIDQERIDYILSGEYQPDKNNKKSNGIGVYNVMERLRIFYGVKDVLQIVSKGEGQGTDVIITIPALGQEEGGDNHVSDTIS